MASEPTTIEVERGSELDRLLDAGGRAPLRLVRGGERFRVNREDVGREDAAPDLATALTDLRPSAEQVAHSIAGIRAAAGSWQGIDTEAYKADIRERRRASSRPPVRWPE